MRLVTFRNGAGGPRLGAIKSGGVIDLARAAGGALPVDMLEFIAQGSDALDRARECVEHSTAQGYDLDAVTLLAPIPRPRKNVFCLGLNYRDHAAETGAKLPERPIYFTKPPTCVIGPDEAIVIDPRISEQVDWEVEFTLVIGRGGRDIAPDRVMDHVYGYTVANDVSARDLQFAHGQWFKGKSLDTFAPIGPCIVTADEVNDPSSLDVSLRVNGVEKQRSNTRELIFDIPTMVSQLSAGTTLEPGDLIMTGTPDGVGFSRKPPEFLKDGDVVEAEVQSIGVLRNPVRVRQGG